FNPKGYCLALFELQFNPYGFPLSSYEFSFNPYRFLFSTYVLLCSLRASEYDVLISVGRSPI
ncbi:hypothetical protein J1N35_008655, partial [Gossypium stocksii]